MENLVSKEIMNTYDLNGIIVDETIAGEKKSTVAVIGVALPKPEGDNNYKIHQLHNISDAEGNKIVIHFIDNKGAELKHGDNFHPFVIDLEKAKPFEASTKKIDLKQKIKVAFHHENVEDISGRAKDIYRKINSMPSLTSSGGAPDKTGTGTIYPS